MSARQRGALIRAVRRGARVGEEDRPVAAEVARRELLRLTQNVRPGRVLVFRVLQGLAAVFLAVVAVSAARNDDPLPAVLYGAAAVVFGSSALLARRRLDRQVARLARALEVNSPAQGEGLEV